MEKAVVGHAIQRQKAFTFFNLLNNFKVGFTLAVTFLLAFLSILALSFLINELIYRVRCQETLVRRRPKLSKRITSVLNSFGAKRLSAIGVFVLFARLFIWITQLFLINNIKTNKVVG